MDLEQLKSRFPQFDLADIAPLFPRIPVADYPELSAYSWEACHEGSMGGGALFLAAEMARKLALQPDMRVLDLGCGHAASSIFLARHHGVTVFAADSQVPPGSNWQRVQRAGVADGVIPLHMDARAIFFPEDYFDAVFSLNAYLYFGTDDLYLPYLARFLRAGGRICIAGPCFATEPGPDTPSVLLANEEWPAFHSPGWWRDHFARSGLVRLLECAEHPRGHAFWLDMVRWIVEDCQARDEPYPDFLLDDMVMLLSDREQFVTYFLLLAEKR